LRFGEEHLLHGDAHQGSFLFLLQLLLIKAADEQQVRELFNDGNGIGNPACPKGFPDFVDLAFQLACDHRMIVLRFRTSNLIDSQARNSPLRIPTLCVRFAPTVLVQLCPDF